MLWATNPGSHVSSFSEILTAHPIARFKRNPRFYLMYDGFYFVLCASACAVMALTGVGSIAGAPNAWWVALFPAVLFAFIWAHVTIHNCTHGNLPRPINRL